MATFLILNICSTKMEPWCGARPSKAWFWAPISGATSSLKYPEAEWQDCIPDDFVLEEINEIRVSVTCEQGE